MHINEELMQEQDGPMLRHGLQEMNGRRLFVPTKSIERPSRERLAERYDEFKKAC